MPDMTIRYESSLTLSSTSRGTGPTHPNGLHVPYYDFSGGPDHSTASYALESEFYGNHLGDRRFVAAPWRLVQVIH